MSFLKYSLAGKQNQDQMCFYTIMVREKREKREKREIDERTKITLKRQNHLNDDYTWNGGRGGGVYFKRGNWCRSLSCSVMINKSGV
jgi:hypothetical protein